MLTDPRNKLLAGVIYRMVALIRKHFAKVMPIGSTRFGRARMADMAVRYIRNVGLEGGYFEFGVYRGSTFATFYHVFRKHGVEHAMWAYDSFEGLPPIGEEDSWATNTSEGSSSWYEGQYRCDLSDFHKFMKLWGVPESSFKVVPGFFSKSLAKSMPPEKAAIIWIDCDLYSSTLCVLKFIKPLLQDGSLVLFDEFSGTDYRGERRALKEFLAQNPDVDFVPYVKFHTKGQSFLVTRK